MKNAGGYGYFKLDGSMVLAHRVAYRCVVDEIADGLQVDHLCRNHACVNPGHMEIVTLVENISRGTIWDHNRLKTQCPRGHAYDEVNTYHDPAGRRRCRECMRENNRRWKQNNRRRENV